MICERIASWFGRLLLTLLAMAVMTSGTSPWAGGMPEYPHGEYDGECEMCHNPERWVPAMLTERFDHGKTGFQLTGAHGQTDCLACHASLSFSDVDSSCVACHLDVHAGEMGTDCARCHTPRNFIDHAAMIRAHLDTRFPLRGAHLSVDCERCHDVAAPGQMQFVNTPTDCYSCHTSDYQATTEPDHQSDMFPTACDRCHTATSWNGAIFRHDRIGGTPCESCHLEQYQATTDPDHQATGFGNNCAQCHVPTGWEGAMFDHRLIGGTPCESCHLAEYDATADPPHRAGGFPLDCTLCHSTSGWVPVSDGFNHDDMFFPIYSGKHNGKWQSCSDCHTSPSNYSQFDCLLCHEHDNEEDLADKHAGEDGYVYESTACYACHLRGTEE